MCIMAFTVEAMTPRAEAVPKRPDMKLVTNRDHFYRKKIALRNVIVINPPPYTLILKRLSHSHLCNHYGNMNFPMKKKKVGCVYNELVFPLLLQEQDTHFHETSLNKCWV